jgi:hypothetical protein
VALLLPDLHRVGAIRFIMEFDRRGAVNFGGCGIPEDVAERLRRAQVIDVWLYKPVGSTSDRWGRRKVTRRYRKVSAGTLMPRLAALLREELRARNLAAIAGFDDGVGRVAFHRDWTERRSDVKAAMTRAWERLQDERRNEG